MFSLSFDLKGLAGSETPGVRLQVPGLAHSGVPFLSPAGSEELHDAHAGGRGAVGPGAVHHHHHPQDPGLHAVPQRRADRRGRGRVQRLGGGEPHPSGLSQTPGAGVSLGPDAPQLLA